MLSALTSEYINSLLNTSLLNDTNSANNYTKVCQKNKMNIRERNVKNQTKH